MFDLNASTGFSAKARAQSIGPLRPLWLDKGLPLSVLLALSLVLSGCGKKSDLVLPQHSQTPPATEETASRTAHP
ncbi:MAG: hypothetical protein JXR44_01320 [Thiotrichales bacterium]|nr:hypothetical protein [Thiotrichales bacterium]